MVKIKHNKSNFIFVKTFPSDLEGGFTRKLDFTWRMSDCKELMVVTQRSVCHFLKLNIKKVVQSEFV